MSDFDDLVNDMEDGIIGRNSGIPMGFQRLNNVITLRKSNIYLVGGYTGSGKTGFVDAAFILNPVDWFIKNKNKTEMDLKVVYWSMERRKGFKLMKWISRKIFIDHGLIIPVVRLMGWCPVDQRLTSYEHDLFLTYRDYIGELLSIIDIRDYPENPTGIRNYMRDLFLAEGTVEELDKHKKIYHPHKPHKIILQVKDHLGLLRKEKNLNTRKEIIDKASEDDRYFRDFYGASSVMVSQFNREIANPMRIKNGDVEPQLEDFKETSNTQEDADIVISLFDPMRYKVSDPTGYDLEKLRDINGGKKYRSLKVLKNSYGADDIRIGLAFQPETGILKEMPKLKDTTQSHYDSINDNSYFLNETN